MTLAAGAGRAGLADFLSSTGARVRYYRYPMLREGDSEEKLQAMRSYLESSGQQNLHLTIDDQDWSFEGPWVAARSQGSTASMDRISEQYLGSLRLSVRHHERTGDSLASRTTPQILLLHANEVGAANWDALFGWLEDTAIAVRRGREAEDAVRDLLEEQTAAWNRGDLSAFVSGYAEDTVYISPNGVVRGRQALHDQYRR
ncbi:MAG: nuclear transport factor 2 family protein [Acidobacteriota bacterium]|nr:nuclear transport factor 2 family protein [Acidobacteriota bacterium]